MAVRLMAEATKTDLYVWCKLRGESTWTLYGREQKAKARPKELWLKLEDRHYEWLQPNEATKESEEFTKVLAAWRNSAFPYPAVGLRGSGKDSSDDELMSMLESGEVDVAVMPRINGLVAMQKDEFENIRKLDGVLETLFLYHYVHKKHSSLVPGLEKELKKMLLDGTTRQMRNDAYGQLLNKDKPWMH